MRFAEFFAGVGLVRLGLEQSGADWTCAFANDVSLQKSEIYRRNFGGEELVTDDVVNICADHLPDVDLITASFPCQDLSLAGKRKGFLGARSGTFRQFARVLSELRAQNRLPRAVMLENVTGLLTSHEGRDIREVLSTLGVLGYRVDLFVIDAVHFLPQSRPRVFITGIHGDAQNVPFMEGASHKFRKRAAKVIYANADLSWGFLALPAPPESTGVTLRDLIETQGGEWFGGERLQKELLYIRDKSQERLATAVGRARALNEPTYLAGYRRMRKGQVSLELRDDGVAGCLRAVNGGSSKQLLVEVGPDGSSRMRYMTAREYARLQGVPDTYWISQSQGVGLHALGDAVAVPVVAWLGGVIADALERQVHSVEVRPEQFVGTE